MHTGWLSEKLNERHVSRETFRNYIGASSIGSDCLRQLYYEFNNFDGEQIPAKLQRIFDVGSTLEGLIISWLQECGLQIEIPGKGNNFLGFKDKSLKYFQGHCDALILEPRSILELKTARDSSFKIFVSKGCKAWSPRYYAQVQSYMGMSEIERASILVLNKDTSEVHDELIEFNEYYYEELKIRAQAIFKAETPPPRVNNSPFWFQCKMCRFKRICHE
jgi:hypothetical protein